MPLTFGRLTDAPRRFRKLIAGGALLLPLACGALANNTYTAIVYSRDKDRAVGLYYKTASGSEVTIVAPTTYAYGSSPWAFRPKLNPAHTEVYWLEEREDRSGAGVTYLKKASVSGGSATTVYTLSNIQARSLSFTLSGNIVIYGYTAFPSGYIYKISTSGTLLSTTGPFTAVRRDAAEISASTTSDNVVLMSLYGTGGVLQVNEIDLTTGSTTYKCDGCGARYTPDGKYILFFKEYNGDKSDIGIYNVNDTRDTQTGHWPLGATVFLSVGASNYLGAAELAPIAAATGSNASTLFSMDADGSRTGLRKLFQTNITISTYDATLGGPKASFSTNGAPSALDTNAPNGSYEFPDGY